MGVLCLQCETAKKEKDESEEDADKPKDRENNLPKQYVKYIDFSEKTDGEETIITEHNEPIKTPMSNNNKNTENDKVSNINNNDTILNKNNSISNDNKKKENGNISNNNDIIKKYAKAKSSILKNEEQPEEQFEKIINNFAEEKSKNNANTDRKKKVMFQTVQNPEEFKKKLHEKDKGKEKEKETNELFNIKKMNKSQRVVFQRRQKKSTTLMENSKILQQLFLAEMSIPISQELLVLQQKGNPSDKYIRGKKIGKGTFGTVYESKNIIFNNLVAMKIIYKDYHMDNLLIKNEIDILKKLSHPNIVRIYEFYESNNCFYIINEFCPEGELYNYINNSKLNEQQLSVIFYQVFSGLKYLHENNILHRDLKPENILISKKEKDLLDGEEYFWIQIIDFGTAKIFEDDKNENSIVGSAYYIAPEVLNKDYNEKCDTWSVGVILYMFLVGRPPFNGSNNEEIVNSIKTKDYDENNPKFLTRSPEVRDLIKHLLEKDATKRLSAKEALNHEWFKKFNGRKLFGNFQEKDIQPYIDNLFNYTFNSKIQQLVIAFLVHNLPHTESSHNILKMYRFFNKAGDCRLTKEELINGLNKYLIDLNSI